jgi:hypothetical protein
MKKIVSRFLLLSLFTTMFIGNINITAYATEVNENDGEVVFEVEDAEIFNNESHNWQEVLGLSSKALQLSPDKNDTWPDVQNLDGNSPELSFPINFSNTGDYDVWILTKAVDGAMDSFHAGLNNEYNFTFNEVSTSGEFTWNKAGSLTIDNAGSNEVNIWAREDGITIDTIFLTQAQLTVDEVIAKTKIEIPKPTALQVDRITTTLDSSATITWDSVDGADGYNVYRMDENDSGFVKLANFDTNEFTDHDVELGLSYSYAVSSVFDGIESEKSPTLDVTIADETVQVPDAPELTLNNVTKNEVSLEWTAVKNTDMYYIYRSSDQGKTYKKIAYSDSNSHLDESVITSKQFYYKVFAVNQGGLSEESNTIVSPITTKQLRQMERLDRGVIPVKTDDGVYVGWRLLGTDPKGISFNLYRDGEKINEAPITSSTNYLDPDGNENSTYAVRAIVNGKEKALSDTANVWGQNYSDIPLNKPADGVTPLGDPYTYRANDASVGDLDGDGQYELVVKWDPSNQKDNSQSGYTGNVYLDAYELDGTQLWRIDLGVNIRAGAHYTQFMVYDLDGDGKSEVALKTADGTVDGTGEVIGDPNADYRNSKGYILSGPEYLTVFDGETGKALDTVNYEPPRGGNNGCDWGDCEGNRVDRFLAAIAYLDGESPSLVMTRGYYTRSVLVAYNFRDGELKKLWTFDSDDPGNEKYDEQGNHNLSIADVDGDGKDEITFGAMAVDHDGTGLYTTGWNHGDAMHLGDLDPNRLGLEVFQVHEWGTYGATIRDASTGKLIWGAHTGEDTGRGMAADIDPRYQGEEVWALSGVGLHKITGEKISDEIPSSINSGIWWDGDLLRELLDHNWLGSSVGAGVPKIDKWDYENSTTVNLLTAEGTYSNNWTKGNPSLQADLLGDWREEVMWRTEDSSALRIYTSTDLTEHRIYTLMHDPVYRMGIAWQNVAYNQPPHPSFFLGHGMESLPTPSIYSIEKIETKLKITPKTLNVKSNGGDQSLQVNVDLGMTDVAESTNNIQLKVNGSTIFATKVTQKGNSLQAKFKRQEVIQAFEGINGNIEVEVLTYLDNGSVLIGRDSVSVIH